METEEKKKGKQKGGAPDRAAGKLLRERLLHRRSIMALQIAAVGIGVIYTTVVMGSIHIWQMAAAIADLAAGAAIMDYAFRGLLADGREARGIPDLILFILMELAVVVSIVLLVFTSISDSHNQLLRRIMIVAMLFLVVAAIADTTVARRRRRRREAVSEAAE